MPLELNPEVVLKAAQVARPEFKWKIEQIMGFDSLFTVVVSRKKSFIGKLEANDERYFQPLDDDADAWALCEALEGMGWVFSCIGATYSTPSGTKRFWNCDCGGRATNGHRSKKIALLAAVSNSTGTPLYLEGGE